MVSGTQHLGPAVGVAQGEVDAVELARAHLHEHALEHARGGDERGALRDEAAAQVLQVVEHALADERVVEALQQQEVGLARQVLARLAVVRW